MIKKNNILDFYTYINENDGGSGGGIATATLSNTGGMGDIVAPQPSLTPGDVAGSTSGSGDIPAYDRKTSFEIPKKKKKKKKKINFGEDYKNMYITKFNEWCFSKK